MMHIFRWAPGSTATTPTALADLPTANALAADEFVWIDLDNPTEVEELAVLERFLPVHPLTLEDVTKARRHPNEGAHLPKVEEFQDYLLVIVSPLPPWVAGKKSEANGDEPLPPQLSRVGRPQLSAVLTPHVLITHHYELLACVADVRGYVARHADCGRRGPDFLFHLVLDAMVDEYAPVVERVAARLDQLETRLFSRPTPDVLLRLLRLKRRVSFLRKTLVLEREVLARLARGEFALVDVREMAYYRNVYDHLVRYGELIESAREMVSDLMQTHLSAASNRLNSVMKVLTMISIVGVVCTLIAGIYGMNFDNMPELKWKYGYPFALSMMGVAAITCLGIFRWLKWL